MGGGGGGHPCIAPLGKEDGRSNSAQNSRFTVLVASGGVQIPVSHSEFTIPLSTTALDCRSLLTSHQLAEIVISVKSQAEFCAQIPKACYKFRRADPKTSRVEFCGSSDCTLLVTNSCAELADLSGQISKFMFLGSNSRARLEVGTSQISRFSILGSKPTTDAARRLQICLDSFQNSRFQLQLHARTLQIRQHSNSRFRIPGSKSSLFLVIWGEHIS